MREQTQLEKMGSYWVILRRIRLGELVILLAKGKRLGSMKKQLSWLFFLVIFAGGCATGKPMSWIDKGTSLSSYQVFEVVPVSNDTGKTYDFDVAADLTKEIKSKLGDKGYRVADNSTAGQSVIVLKSSLILYEPGSALKRWLYTGYGATQCTVKSALIDKKKGETIGEIQVAKTISEGGLLYSIGAHMRILDNILDNVAADIAHEIDNRMKER